MKIISHRGNISGPVAEKENRPSYIDCAIAQKYDVEVDIRYMDNKFYLGHDTPDYEISTKWINLRKENIWFHCKNIEAAYQLSLLNGILYFCHSVDNFVLTSNGLIWAHEIKKATFNSIIPLLNLDDINNNKGISDIYGICTDYPALLKK